MTLNSNKNEPAVTLERVNSARTALSDLYLEQLLQNKPKSDKVRGFALNKSNATHFLIPAFTFDNRMLAVSVDSLFFFFLSVSLI